MNIQRSLHPTGRDFGIRSFSVERHTLRFKRTGKNASVSRFKLGLTYII